MIRVRRAHAPLTDDERDAIRDLHAQCMPGDSLYDLDAAIWWLAWVEGEPVGYAAARADLKHDAAFFVAAGVLPKHRRIGLHRRLIRARLAWASLQGVSKAVTYTLLSNVGSANGLIRAGFKRSAAWCYVGPNVDYWERDL